MNPNPYVICKQPTACEPTGDEPTVREQTGFVWSRLADLHEKILSYAAVTETGSYRQWFSKPLGAETPDDDRRLMYMSVEGWVTWIFKCNRKDIENAHGELEVTIKRSLLPTQTCVWWQSLTEQEKLTCQSNLEYSKTWSNVQRIIMVHSNSAYSPLYYFDFQVHNDEPEMEATSQAPRWEHWTEYKETNVRPLFEDTFIEALDRSRAILRGSIYLL
jgi:hypothetical protein